METDRDSNSLGQQDNKKVEIKNEDPQIMSSQEKTLQAVPFCASSMFTKSDQSSQKNLLRSMANRLKTH